jgi:hypothetical protein
LRERGNISFSYGIVFVARYEHADAPYAVALLSPRRDRPGRSRAAEKRDAVAPSKANSHLPLPYREPYEQK